MIKQVDPNYADLEHQIGTTGGDNQEVTIKSGETLSHVSKLFYGTPNKYEAIAKASNISDPNKVQVGQKITVPPLS